MSSEQALYIVATPIGNRDDISTRAVEILHQVDRIYVEDTRHSQSLLRHHGINTRLKPLHEHNEQSQIEAIISHLQSPATAALISDAGTPLISDPGFKLVRACQQAGIRVSPIPGACALTAALSVCGMPSDRFEFFGFVPSRSGARKALFGSLAQVSHTMVFYEAPHRIVDCMRDIVGEFGSERPMSVARELTKRFETILFGNAESVLADIEEDNNQQKGEFVVIVGGQLENNTVLSSIDATAVDKMLGVLLQQLPAGSAARCVAEIQGVSKKLVYQRALALQGKQ
ncbi:MAG: 16S rRNA (cytidine(1402)-2'-O)-methyltransferase [Granulosicoccus sp.]|nr:16S rRNA (cytidine(1402)-2'-O)-methyltransferase [Granulosicoccus sp.]